MGVTLVDRTEQIKQALREQVAVGINNACQYAVSEMRDLVPVDTGELKSTIRIDRAAVPARLETIVACGSPEVNYAHYINYGTSKMAAQPFFTVGMLLTREKFPQFLYGRGRR